MTKKGQKINSETRQRISNSLKGRSVWNTNKNWKKLEKGIIGVGKRGIFKWIKNKDLQVIARRDYATAKICEEEELFKPAIILYAGLMEALLIYKMNDSKDKDFANLIVEALKRKLISREQANHMHTIRDFRNYVHVYKEISAELEIINKGIAQLCRQLCDSVIKTLKDK